MSDNISNVVYGQLSKRGYKSRLVSIDHLPQLKQDIESAFEKNHLPESIRSYVMDCLDFSAPDSFDASTILITAEPSPRWRVIFAHQGKKRPLFIPPTYVEFSANPEKIINLIKTIPGMCDNSLEKANLPKKLLAVRSGLGAYGRNNICYVPGLGSLVLLEAFFTDIPCEEDCWHGVNWMDACGKCSICVKRCPTGSIGKERSVINASKCLTYFNEHEGLFPDWLDASWHNCIVGCFLCQETCPENKNHLGYVVDAGEFSEEETEMLLNNQPLENLPVPTKEKLDKLNMLVYYDCLSRNLKALLAKEI